MQLLRKTQKTSKNYTIKSQTLRVICPLENDNTKLKAELDDTRNRSMRSNLVFHNIPESEDRGYDSKALLAEVISRQLNYGLNEAKDLIEIGGAKSIKNFNELQEAFSYFFSNYQKNICKNYIMQKCGSTKLVIKKI